MLILKNATECGIYKPEDLAFLQGVFAEACAADGAAKRDDIARKLLTLFRGGTRDRELMLLTITKPSRPYKDPVIRYPSC